MSLYASVALFRRDGKIAYRPPRKEASAEVTQARKSASRFWSGNISAPDRLTRIIVTRADGPVIRVSERVMHAGAREWVEFTLQPRQAAEQPHLAACMAELGIDPSRAAPPVPDELEINGAIYRRVI